MPRIGQGPGGGPKRRIRTRLQSVDSTTCLILRNRSKKALPANWRELLVETVMAVCATPPKHFFGTHASLLGRRIPRPDAFVAPDSLPSGVVVFTLSRSSGAARLQKRALDWALSRCDVNHWPVPKPTNWNGRGGERFVNTGLLLQDRLVGDNRHRFNPYRLKGVSDIDWRHLEQYTARKGKAEYLGVRTRCGGPCPCRRLLPDLWALGWEMHY